MNIYINLISKQINSTAAEAKGLKGAREHDCMKIKCHQFYSVRSYIEILKIPLKK